HEGDSTSKSACGTSNGSLKANNSLSGDNMMKMTRLAAWAMIALTAMPTVLLPSAAFAQAQQAAPAAPASSDTAAQPPAPAPAPAPGATKTTEVVENPYGLQALWAGGDIVSKGTIAILVIMSMGSWYIIVTKVYEQSRMARQARAAEKKFWNAPSVRQGA